MADINNIAEQFTKFYYETFDSNNRRPESMLSWEGSLIVGEKAISEKLINLPFKKVQHQVTTRDAQPSNPSVASLIVSVTGLLVIDDGERPLQFSQIFHLIPNGESYYVLNDIFRLNYG
ncbi:hypothetical protein H0H87_004957 [Tephrocybe sp. NHM501043]|nr:hypothetical protein H0H87_004957 [Tephrocybe sp. NHM501043]